MTPPGGGFAKCVVAQLRVDLDLPSLVAIRRLGRIAANCSSSRKTEAATLYRRLVPGKVQEPAGINASRQKD